MLPKSDFTSLSSTSLAASLVRLAAINPIRYHVSASMDSHAWSFPTGNRFFNASYRATPSRLLVSSHCGFISLSESSRASLRARARVSSPTSIFTFTSGRTRSLRRIDSALLFPRRVTRSGNSSSPLSTTSSSSSAVAPERRLISSSIWASVSLAEVVRVSFFNREREWRHVILSWRSRPSNSFSNAAMMASRPETSPFRRLARSFRPS